MLKRLLAAAACLALALAVPHPAHAAWKFEEDVFWRHTGRGDIGFSEGPVNRQSDTTFVSAAPARVDTTTAWSMLDADMPTANQWGNTATTGDTVTVGKLVISADSTVASSVNFKNTTVQFQINYGHNATGWQNWQGALSVLPTDGVKDLIAPIFIDGKTITQDLGIDFKAPVSVFAPQMRAIVTWGTSAAAPSCRLAVYKFVLGQIYTRPGVDVR